MGLLTKGKYYIKSHDDGIKEPRYDAEGTPVATVYHCAYVSKVMNVQILCSLTNITARSVLCVKHSMLKYFRN